jgi:hypothetical protein
MFKLIEFSNAAAIGLVNDMGIYSMANLSRITTTRTSKFSKAIRSPGGGRGGGGTNVGKDSLLLQKM